MTHLLNELNGNESIKEIRAFIRSYDFLRGIKTSGAGRTKQVIVKEINQRIRSNKKSRRSKPLINDEKDHKDYRSTSSNKMFLYKFELWTKFMQSGKTKEMTDEMRRIANNYHDYFHIIFCSNNLFLTNQTQSRVKDTYQSLTASWNDIDAYDIDESSKTFLKNLKAIVYTSSNAKCNKYKELKEQFNDYRSILCCTNKVRFEAIEQLLNEEFDDDRKVIMWIDEVHTDVNMIMGYLSRISKLKCVKKIIGISATPDSIFKNETIDRTDEITLKPMKACNPSIYYGYYDIDRRIIDVDFYKIPDIIRNNKKYDCTQAVKQRGSFVPDKKIENALYLNTLLESKKITYTNKDVFYVPGIRYKLSHSAILDVLLSHAFYVFIFNGDGSYLYKTKDEVIDLKAKTQTHLGQLMGNIRREMRLNKAIGITGYLSIGQGNTLCDYDTDFYITKSVIGHKSALKANGDCNAFVTQVFGRCFGNIKQRERFKGSQVYMRKTFSEQIGQCILSGALSHFALNTGHKRMSWNDLPKVKSRVKRIFAVNDEYKAENNGGYVPISFSIGKRDVFFKLQQNVKNKNKLAQLLAQYLKRPDSKADTDQICQRINNESYSINQKHICVVTKTDRKYKKKFEKIKECEAKQQTYPSPVQIQNTRNLWIIMDLSNDDARCFALLP